MFLNNNCEFIKKHFCYSQKEATCEGSLFNILTPEGIAFITTCSMSNA